jgi:DNA-binding Lrp family transcriptional regulator
MEELASVVGLSRVAVRARVLRLVSSDALRVVGVVHPSAQGLRAFAHLSITVRGSALAVGEAIAALKNVPLVSIVAGRTALIAEARSTDIESLREVIRVVAAMDNVMHVETAVYTERIKDLYAPPGTIPPTEIDDVDRHILDALERDGRTSYAEIGRQIQFSPSAIRGRVNQLTSRGVVRISALISPGIVGLHNMCGVGLRFNGGAKHDAVSVIEAMKSVSYLSLTLGRWDAIGTLFTTSEVEMVSELDRLRLMPAITGLESWMHLKVIKGS